MRILGHDTHHADETLARSIVKALSYRGLVVALDFGTIYLFTGKFSVALGFTLASNVYTTAAYLVHERVWDRVKWGRRIFAREDDALDAPAV
jgi:adenylylsulfate kinase